MATNKNESTSLFSYIANHWTIFISLGYIFLSGIGMINSHAMLSRYDINIFDYAEINDFLLVAFRSPILVVNFVIVTCIALLIATYIDTYREVIRKQISGKSIRSTKIKIKFIIYKYFRAILALVFISAGAATGYISRSLDYKSQGDGDVISISLKHGKLPGFKKIESEYFFLIGTSENYFFLYSPKNKKSYVVPVSNIVGMSIKKYHPQECINPCIRTKPKPTKNH